MAHLIQITLSSVKCTLGIIAVFHFKPGLSLSGRHRNDEHAVGSFLLYQLLVCNFGQVTETQVFHLKIGENADYPYTSQTALVNEVTPREQQRGCGSAQDTNDAEKGGTACAGRHASVKRSAFKNTNVHK